MRLRGAICAALLLAACDSPQRAGPGLPGGPPPPLAAHPIGSTRSLSIGPAGDSLTFAGASGSLTLTVPAGALDGSVEFTISEVSPNTAVGGAGSAFEILPAEAPLLGPVTLTFTPADPSAVPGLTATHQSELGYWFRVYDVQRTATGLSTQTRLMGVWTLATLATAQDLSGPFRVDTTLQDVPLHAEGTVTLQYVGGEPGFTYYIPIGTATPSSPGCDPVDATDLPWSLAELHPDDPPELQLRWAILGAWTLTCGTARPFVSLGFDTMGIYNQRCTSSYSTSLPVFLDASHLEGQYVVDCGTRGKVTASWDLRLPGGGAPDPLPAP